MAVFTDYSKAFVTIDFYTLTQKMHLLNFFFSINLTNIHCTNLPTNIHTL